MELIEPQWQLPPQVRSAFSTRRGGVSDPPYHSLNLSVTVDDDRGAVGENRMRLRNVMPAPSWLQQAHSSRVVLADEMKSDETVADAVYTFNRNVVCAVTVADCVPILLCATDGSCIAAVHAGWRGLGAGIIENTVAALRADIHDLPLMAWIGPAICRQHYEVGDDVRSSLCQTSDDEAHFVSLAAADNGGGKKWLADLPAIAASRMQKMDIAVTMSGLCTYGDSQRFFSVRRDKKCGRQAAMIWISD